MLFGLKLILQKYQKTQKLTEDDNEGFGFNSYSIKIEDPSATNALNSSIFSEMKAIHDVLIVLFIYRNGLKSKRLFLWSVRF